MARLNKTPLTLRVRRGLASQITATSPAPFQVEGEMAYATDTGGFYISNGTEFVLLASGLQDLQSVTDVGNITTNPITTEGVTSPYYLLDTTATPTLQQGMLFWDEDRSTVGLQMNGVEARLGQDNFWYVKNQTGSPIPKGTAVMAVGALGASSRILVAPMIADGSVDEQYFLGITAEEILDGEDGFVTNIGKIRGIDTSVYGTQAGQILYCDPANPGGFTITQPQAPNLNIPAAFTVDYKSNGTIAVRALPGYHLSELHDVYINTPSDQDILLYNGTNNRWENTPLASAVPTPTLDQVTTAGNSTTNGITVGNINANGQIVTRGATLPSFAANGSVVVGSTNVTNSLGVLLGVQIPYVTGAFGGHFIGYSNQASPKWLIGISRNIAQENALVYYEDSLAANPRFAIHSGGNVTIGTTTDAGYKLDVNGTARITSELIVQDIYIGKGGDDEETNTAVGYNALANNTVPYFGAGFRNTAFGYNALFSNTTGSRNTSVGRGAGESNTTGASNVFLGESSGQQNIIGSSNVYIGHGAGGVQDSSGNTYVGTSAGYSAAQGTGNSVYIGLLAGHATTGGDNVFLGNNAGFGSTKSDWLIIGNRNNPSLIEGNFATGNVMIGTSTDAGYKLDVNGSSIFRGDSYVTGKLGIGRAPENKLHVKDFTTTNASNITGTPNDTNNYVTQGVFKIHNSNSALYFGSSPVVNDRRAWIQSGHESTTYSNAYGSIALNPLGGNVGIGVMTPTATLDVNGTARVTSELTVDDGIVIKSFNASTFAIGNSNNISSLTNAGNTFVFGNNALANALVSIETFALGDSALGNSNYSGNNIAIGTGAGRNVQTSAVDQVDGGYNVLIGVDSGGSLDLGFGNVFLGYGSGSSMDSNLNVAIGNYAGGSNTAGRSNVYIGNSSGGFSTGQDNVFIGSQSGLNSTKSDWLIIGNRNNAGLIEGSFATGNVLIGTSTDSGYKLDVNGSTRVQGNLTVDTNTLFVDATNNRVGIGTTSPSKNMVVQGTNAKVEIRALDESQDAHLYFGTPFVNAGPPKAAIIAEGETTWSRSKLHFCLENSANNSSTAEVSLAHSRMVITKEGNVGIGTTSPAYRLDVNGSSRVLATSSSPTLTLGRASGQPTIQANTDAAGYLIMDSNGAAAALNWYSSNEVVLANGGGNVLIGTSTDSGYKLDVSGVTFTQGLISRGVGANSTVIGLNASVNGTDGVAIGDGAECWYNLGSNAVAIGVNSTASLGNSTAIGGNSRAAGAGSVAIGANTDTGDNGGIAIGQSATTSAYGMAIGHTAVGSAQNSIAIGRVAQATVDGAIAIGQNANATNTQAISIGRNQFVTKTMGTRSIAIGLDKDIQISSDNIIIGYMAKDSASNLNARNVVIGHETLTHDGDTYDSVFVGYGAKGRSYAHGRQTVAVGRSANTWDYSVAVGYSAGTNSWGVAVGYDADAKADSVSLGAQAIASAYTTSIGRLAGSGASGQDNVFLGYGAGSSNTNSDWFILKNRNYSSLIEGNFATGNVMLGTSTDNGYKLDVNGTVAAQLSNASQLNSVYYDVSTGELTYDTTPATPTLAEVTAAGNSTDQVFIGYEEIDPFNQTEWQNLNVNWDASQGEWGTYELDVNGIVNSVEGFAFAGGLGVTQTLEIKGPWAMAIVDSAGGLQAIDNLTCVKGGTGTYVFSFITPAPSAEYVVTATFNGATSNVQDWTAIVSTRDANGFTIVTTSEDNGTTADPPTDLSFELVVNGAFPRTTLDIQGGIIVGVS